MSDSLRCPVTGTCISASAGTGKTYALSSRFLALLALGAPPESLIALTFTNKAAGEFRNRILSALAEGALSEKSINPAAQRVVETLCGLRFHEETHVAKVQPDVVPLAPAVAQTCTGLTTWESCLQAAESALGHSLDKAFFTGLLNQVVQRLSRIQLSTLDSFFQKIVSSHCMEFGISEIQPLMGEALENARREALLYMLGMMDDPECRSAFVAIYQDVLGDQTKGMLDKLAQKVQAFLSVYRRLPQEGAWTNTQAFVHQDLSRLRPLSAEEKASLWSRFDEALANVSQDSCLQKAAKNALEAFPKQMKKEDFSEKKNLEKYLNNGDYSSPAHRTLKELVHEIKDRYVEDAMHAPYRQTLGMYKLMKQYTERYQREIQSTGRFTFDEMTLAAGNILEDMGCDVASELDARLEHWMLDEFQDTAPAQWKALANPLLLEAAENSPERYRGKQLAPRSIFVVGDMKQSIYGFRNARPELFAQLSGDPAYAERDEAAERCKQALHPTLLNCSYRSAPELMGPAESTAEAAPAVSGFINQLFEGLHQEEQINQAPYAVDLTAYCKHSTANNETMRRMKGYVRIAKMAGDAANADDTGNEDIDTLMQQSVAAVLRELQDETDKTRLKNGITAAVLVRSNTEAQSLVQYLQREMEGLPVQLISDSFVALDSALGELFMSFFLWLSHPSDQYRRNILSISGLNTAEDSHEKWMQKLAERGYASVIDDLVQRLQVTPGSTVREWMTAAMDFDTKGGSLAAWMRDIRQRSEKGVGSPRYVQVMTMHKSKGLEFDAVILPYKGSKAVDDTGKISYFESEDGKCILLSPGDAKKRALFGAPMLACENRWKQQRRQEAYNLMYVAMTRAKYANYILLHPKAKTGSESGMILQAWQEAADAHMEENVRQFGTQDWYANDALVAEKQKKANEGQRKTEKQQELGEAVTQRRKASPSRSDEDRTEESVSETAKKKKHVGDAKSAAFGTAVHALFEQLEWWQTGTPLPFSDDGSKAFRVVNEALKKPDIAAIFRPKAGMVVYNEQPFEQIREEQGRELWISGVIDRLVLERTLSEGRNEEGEPIEVETVTAAHIIDYKTDRRVGATAEEEDTALIAAHRAQMEAYRELISAAFGLPEAAVSVTLVSVPSDGAPARLVPVPLG